MSFDHFALENEISSVTRMDQPLSTKGPVARWQRKALETSSNSHQAGANASGLNSSSTGKIVKFFFFVLEIIATIIDIYMKLQEMEVKSSTYQAPADFLLETLPSLYRVRKD